MIADGESEDQLIENGLKNRERYEETDENPMEEYINRIENFAAAGLREGEITEEQYRFITNKQKPHLPDSRKKRSIWPIQSPSTRPISWMQKEIWLILFRSEQLQWVRGLQCTGSPSYVLWPLSISPPRNTSQAWTPASWTL